MGDHAALGWAQPDGRGGWGAHSRSPVPVALPDTLSIWEAMKLTCVLYVACTLRRIRSISRMVSSLPCRTSKSFHVCQKAPVVCGGEGAGVEADLLSCSLPTLAHLPWAVPTRGSQIWEQKL